MEEILMIDAAERYLNGEMSQQEKQYFEEIRRSNPEVDQLIAEHIYFIHEMRQYADIRKLKSALQSAHLEHTDSLSIIHGQPKIIPISFWKRYSKTIAVASVITVFSTFLCTTLLNSYNKKNQTNIKPLVEKLNEQDQKYKDLEIQIDKLHQEASASTAIVKPKIKSNFRATGFMIDATANYIITNAHVVSEATHHIIVENNLGQQFNAKIIYVDQNTDLAVLTITDEAFIKMDPVPFSLAKDNINLGESIFTLGFPKQEIVYGEGYVSAENGYHLDTSFFQLSTAANEGNSGSPVINKEGNIIGVISSAETDAEGVVFAIKSKYVLQALEKINGKLHTSLPSKKTDRHESRVEQIQKVKNYIFMIKGN